MAKNRKGASDDAIKEAVFSEILRAPVKIYYPNQQEEPDGVIITGFQLIETQPTQQDASPSKSENIEVFVCKAPPLPKVLNKISSHLNCSSALRSEDCRLKIRWNIAVGQLRSKVRRLLAYQESTMFGLWFNGMPLSDAHCTVDSIGVRNGSTIEVRLRAHDDNDDEQQLSQVIYLNADLFDEKNDYYYSDSAQSAKRSSRSGKRFSKPIGWKRYALNVAGVSTCTVFCQWSILTQSLKKTRLIS